jgi:photosystem II stability/assembly factor-like uncharacterized protein
VRAPRVFHQLLWIATALAVPLLIGAERAAIPVKPVGDSGIPPVRDMHLMTPSTGWVLAGQDIYWTDTGGQSWTKITPPLEGTQRIDGAYFLDAAHGWALLHTWQTMTEIPEISLALTTDGGKSWSVAPLQASQDVRRGYGNVPYFPS